MVRQDATTKSFNGHLFSGAWAILIFHGWILSFATD
jgi:hypothetical protein